MGETSFVTAYDATPQACAERIVRILASDTLTFTARGGGIPQDEIVLQPREWCFIQRDELREILRHLRATTPEQGEQP